MSAVVVLPLAVCLALAVTSALPVPALGRLRRYAGIAAAATVLASGIVLVVAVLDGQTPTAVPGQLRVDGCPRSC
jgi:hypothetical protein